MAFNSIDYVIPDSVRAQALSEIHRVLKDAGVVIFSSHNPRAFWVRPGWSRSRVQQVAARVSGGRKTVERLAIGILTILRACTSAATSLALSAARLARRLPKRAFWRGEGYMLPVFLPRNASAILCDLKDDTFWRSLPRGLPKRIRLC